ncbi:MAG TPA: serine--tRNA ligase [Acidimicrobiales bacterium]|nr:serine--tRNA ligase [Acidimicrobiales bacterium]
MIDIRLVRREPERVAALLARRGVDPAEVARIASLDAAHREQLAAREALRARVKALSREVGAARRSGDQAQADVLAAESRAIGDEERAAGEVADALEAQLHQALLYLPNLPADEAPDGAGAADNVEVRRWWPGIDAGRPEQPVADHQRVPHWEVGTELGLLDMEAGARLSGSMFPLFRGDGARLLRALTSLALARHADAYEEVRPPSLVLTDTMTSTGHLPKFADEAYHVERDGLWAIPTAEVPLTSLRRGDILAEHELPLRLCAVTPCFRREAGAAGRETRGLLRVHEFDKVELFAYATEEQAPQVHADILARAEGLLRELELPYRVLDLCAGDLGASSARTFDLEVYAPGSDQWLEVSSVSWFRDYQARRANVRYRPAAGGSLRFVHTLNGSALAWPRVWAALVERGRQPDGTVRLPAALAPYWQGEPVVGRLESR